MNTDNITNVHSSKTKIFIIITGIVILVSAIGISTHWLMNRPRAKRKPPSASIPLVETKKIVVETHRIIVRAMGTVIPTEKVDIVAQVIGKIIEINPDFIPGGYIKKGELLAQVDPSDYKLSVEESESAVQQALKDLTLEEAQQKIALNELTIFLKDKNETYLKIIEEPAYNIADSNISETDKELILRKPQLKSIEAFLKAAIAQKEKAELNLKRTAIKAPFNAVIQTKEVGRGSYVSPGNTVAVIVNTDSYWIEISVPVDQLKWIKIPFRDKESSRVKVYYESAWGKDKYLIGEIKEMEPSIETQGRMAQLLVEVNDPLSLKKENAGKPVLLLNVYARVEIEGKNLEKSIKLSREYLRDNDTVWIITPDNKLNIRKVNIAATAPEYVYITKGVNAGAKIITSDIPTPVEGMSLQSI